MDAQRLSDRRRYGGRPCGIQADHGYGFRSWNPKFALCAVEPRTRFDRERCGRLELGTCALAWSRTKDPQRAMGRRKKSSTRHRERNAGLREDQTHGPVSLRLPVAAIRPEFFLDRQ